MTVKNIKINEDNEGRRIDNFLISILPSVPRSKVYNIIRKGEVRVNSSRIKPSYKLKISDQVRIPPNLEILKNSYKFIKQKEIIKHTQDILFENKNFIVANKRNDIAVHAGSKNYIGLVDIFRKKYGENIDLCHRLDKHTSGCIVFAKNKKAAKHFSKCLPANKVKKTYSAILKGDFKGVKLIDIPVYKNINSNTKKAISKFSFKKKLKNTTLVDIQIFTGRTHQIRIHAAEMKHPIIYDKRYGDINFDEKLNVGNYKMPLHSKKISFPDLNNKIIKTNAEYPIEFKNLLMNLN
jgi:23S rRNA pseudouridine955/2504/2580 synthase